MPGGQIFKMILDQIYKNEDADHAHQIVLLLLKYLNDDYILSNDYQLNENILSKVSLIINEHFLSHLRIILKF